VATMLESLLNIGSFCWSGHAYHTACEPIATRVGLGERLQGRFACVSGSDGDVTLARDRLGLNKLFLAVHESGTVVAGNYLCDLVGHGVPFEAIHSVPAGYVVRLVPREDRVEVSRYGDPRDRAGSTPASVDDVASGIRDGACGNAECRRIVTRTCADLSMMCRKQNMSEVRENGRKLRIRSIHRVETQLIP